MNSLSASYVCAQSHHGPWEKVELDLNVAAELEVAEGVEEEAAGVQPLMLPLPSPPSVAFQAAIRFCSLPQRARRT